MGAPTLDARDLVERLWQQTQARRQAIASTLNGLEDVEALTHSDELRYLNARWRLDVPSGLPRVGPAWKHRAKERVAQLVLHLLDRYFTDERDFLAHVVRFQNKVAVAHDELVDQLRELIDQLRDESRRLAERDELLHRLLEERVEQLEHEVGVRA